MRHSEAHDFVGRSVPRSTFYDSPFGRMFGRLEPWQPAGTTDEDKVAALLAFAEADMVEATGTAMDENPAIPAGYTYFGQFIDHDITFDPTSSKVRQNDPNKLKNFRTPRLDLDSVYLAGPHASPFLYDPHDFGKFLIGRAEPGPNPADPVEADLPRNQSGTALIGDPRNDENIIVSQLQLAFLKLHNRVLDKVREVHATADPEAQFVKAQRVVCWFYQYVVWNDFMKRLVHDTLWRDALVTHTDDVAAGKSTTTRAARKRFYRWKRAPYIPVEFSVAAYRFGHSMVRPGYQVNFHFGIGERFELPIFSDPMRPSSDLRGGRVLPRGHTIQWDWYFKVRSGGGFPQASRKIDTKLSPAMSHIPMGDMVVPLAFLNLQRGWRMDLPSGPAIADLMGVPDAARPSIAPGTPEECLWYYVLRETSTLGGMSRKMLGPVGGTIVAEVFAGLLDGDPLSFINLDPLWSPATEVCLDGLIPSGGPVNGGDWEVADLLVAAGVDAAPTISPSGGAEPLIFPADVPIRGERVVV